MSLIAPRSFVKVFCFFSFFIAALIIQAKGDSVIMKLSSPAFVNQTAIPILYTAQGKNISPPLHWTHAPQDTMSFVLICEDPDAPGGPFDHWILYNIPPSFVNIPENFSTLLDGIHSGLNSWGNEGYGGPNPPSGTHRYIFTLYALDTELDLPPKIRKRGILLAMQSHVLAQARLIGRYSRTPI